MADWFIWKGINCTDLGIHVATQPEITLPLERVSTVTIPGRSAALIVKEGDEVYDSIQYQMAAFIEDTSRLSEIIRYLRGNDKLVIARRPDGFYKAIIANQLTLSLVLRDNPHRAFSIQFTCDPFFYFNSGAIERACVSGTTDLTNSNCVVRSYPTIKMTSVSGGTVNKTYLMIGNRAVYVSSFVGTLIIDTLNGLAVTPNDDGTYENRCSYVSLGEASAAGASVSWTASSEWPVIIPDGNNIISWFTEDSNGNLVTDAVNVSVTPNWRTL